MSTSRPFAYNTGSTISGTEQIGNLAIGVPTNGFDSTGLQWFNGPDEDLGYVIAYEQINNAQPTPNGGFARVQFWRSKLLTNQDFLNLCNSVIKTQTFNDVTVAKTYLNNNGYWTSFEIVTPTPTPSITPTPSTPSNLVVYLDSGNVSSYPTTGSTWYDLVGVSNNATLINSPTYSSNFNGILNFDDVSSEYATIPNIGNLNTWTVEVWFRLTSPISSKISSFVSNQFDGVNKLNFSIGTNNAPFNYNIAVGFYDGAWRNTTGFSPLTNVWYQVVGTYDGSVIRQYVNGVATGGTLNYAGTPQSGGEVRLMRRWDDTLSSNNLIDGDLSIVKIYNTALNSTQILQNYNENVSRFISPTPSVTPTQTVTPTVTPTPSITPTQTVTPTVTPTKTVTPTPSQTPNVPVTSNLVLYYDPSNSSSYSGSGNVINDLSGNGLNGTMSNITFTSPYFSYNGTNSQISIPDNSLLEPGSGSWTMEVWVNQNASGNDVVLGKFDPGGLSADVSYSIRTTSTTYYAQIGSGSGSGSSLFVNSSNYIGTLNTWSQIVYVFKNGATKTLETFVNGSSIGSVSHNLASILNTSSNLYIGSYNNGEYSQWFDGKIGITRLYNNALTSEQVLQNYNANKSKYGL